MDLGKYSRELTQLAVKCEDQETRHALVAMSVKILKEGGVILSNEPILRTEKQSGYVVEKGQIVGEFEQKIILIDKKIETTVTMKGDEPVTSYSPTEFLGLMG